MDTWNVIADINDRKQAETAYKMVERLRLALTQTRDSDLDLKLKKEFSGIPRCWATISNSLNPFPNGLLVCILTTENQLSQPTILIAGEIPAIKQKYRQRAGWSVEMDSLLAKIVPGTNQVNPCGCWEPTLTLTIANVPKKPRFEESATTWHGKSTTL